MGGSFGNSETQECCAVLHQRGFENLSLKYSPFLKKAHGTGVMANATKASKLQPHPNPSLSNILWPARGRTAPTADRTAVLAARAEAAYIVYASTIYV